MGTDDQRSGGDCSLSRLPAAISNVNPNPVEVGLSLLHIVLSSKVTRPDGSKAILLHYDTMNNPGTNHHGLDMQIWSGDDGLTHLGQRHHLAHPPQNNTGALIGPSVGIQSSTGTLYFSAIGFKGHFLYFFSCDSDSRFRASLDWLGRGARAR